MASDVSFTHPRFARAKQYYDSFRPWLVKMALLCGRRKQEDSRPTHARARAHRHGHTPPTSAMRGVRTNEVAGAQSQSQGAVTWMMVK